MSAILRVFNGVELPPYDTAVPAGSGPTQDGTVKLPGGGYFDAHGTGRAPLELPYDLPFRGTLAEDSLLALDARLTALRGLRGITGRLLRELGNGTTHWCEARCLRVPALREAGALASQQVDLDFQVRSPWYGALHAAGWYIGETGIYLGDGHVLGHSELHTLTAATTDVTLTNGGDGQVTGMRITVTAGPDPITYLSVSCFVTGIYLTFNGTIAPLTSLVIDTGAWSVLNHGLDAFAQLETAFFHRHPYWMLLEPGANVVRVLRVGGDATATVLFEFSDVHE